MATDPVSAFGSVLGFNRPLAPETAEEIAKTFVEAIAAPGYSAGARQRLASKKDLRLVEMTDGERAGDQLQWRQISGGLLVQTADLRPTQAGGTGGWLPSARPAKRRSGRYCLP